MSGPVQRGSSSLSQPDYWWYRARSGLLEAALGTHVGSPARLLDVGSADGPSVGWLRGRGARYTLDVFPEGQQPGRGVCGSASALPFADAAFDLVVAFDVVEHCADEALAMSELARVLAPGGRLLLSVPAYTWAWSDHDVRAGHHRRYTRPRLVRAVASTGLSTRRSTYAFAAVFPFFAVERVLRRLRSVLGCAASSGLTPVSPRLDAVLTGLCRLDAARLARGGDLPFGSSVLLAAVKPAR